MKTNQRAAAVLMVVSLLCGGILVSQSDINEGLTAYYSFDNAGNLTADSSGNNRNLTLIGSGLPIDGIKSGAFDFDGFSYLQSNSAGGFNTMENFTWSLWFRTEDDITGSLIGKAPGFWEPGSRVLFVEDGIIIFDIGELGAAEFDGGLNDNEWHHVVVSNEFFEGGDGEGIVLLYVDGVQVAEFDEPAGSVFRVGNSTQDFIEIPEYFGQIDEVRIYNRAVEEDEVLELLLDGQPNLPAPVIVTHPSGLTGIVGRSATFSVEANGLAISYQWFKNGEPIEEAEGSRLTLSDLTQENLGSYSVGVSNPSGDIMSDAAELSLLDEWNPEIGLVGQWTFDAQGNPGQDTSGSGNDLEPTGGVGQVEGIKGLAFEGIRSTRVEDAMEGFNFDTLSDFTWTAMIKTDDDGGIMGKSPAEWSPGSKALFVRDGVLGFDVGWIGDVNASTEIIDSEWHHVAVTVGSLEDENLVQLYVDGNVEAEWEVFLADQPDAGIFNIGYSSDNFPFEEEPELNFFGGSIDEVRVYNQALITADIITLMLEDGGSLIPAGISSQPEDTTAIEGRTARFRVGVTGTAPAVQWYKDGEIIEDATNAGLSVPGVSEDDEGSYHAVVSNDQATVTSEAATLTVEPAPVFGGGELAHVGAFLESYWDFNSLDADGLVSDLAPLLPAHDGELVNGAILTTGNSGYGGSGEALNPSAEEGASMWASMPESYDFDSDFTWAAWVKMNEIPGGGESGAAIFSRVPRDIGHQAGSKVLYLSDTTPGFDTGWVGAINSNEPEIDLDTWHHVAMTFQADEDLVSIYLDGEPIIDEDSGEEVLDFDAFGDDIVNEFPENELPPDGDQKVNSGFRIGSGANNIEEPFFSDPFAGVIDDAAVWSIALSPEDVALLAEGASPLPELAPDAPSLSIARGADGIVIEFEGTLQVASEATGPWVDLDVTSPLSVSADGDQGFYRAKN